jgi:hypothetical protein
MFKVRDYARRGLISAIGKLPDYEIILNSIDYYQNGLLTELDLEEINTMIDRKNYPPEIEPSGDEITPEEPIEVESEVEENDNTEIQDMDEGSND